MVINHLLTGMILQAGLEKSSEGSVLSASHLDKICGFNMCFVRGVGNTASGGTFFLFQGTGKALFSSSFIPQPSTSFKMPT